MKDLLPSGSLIYSTNKDLDFYFGFCYCTVNVPDNLDKPILPYRDENGNICNPIGSWSGWYSSELLKKARELGISVEVHYGYTYENKEYLFKSYVETYYNLRKQYSNNTGKNLIYKLLLNSLYGRLGLKHINTITKLVSKSEALEILLKYKVLENETIDASKNLEYIKFIKEPSDILNIIDFAEFVKVSNDSLNKNDFINRNVSISAMITSKAAIFMDQFINIENNECYYTDTDSVILEKPLLDSAIGKDIGKFKFIAKIKRAYFISPKFYCLVAKASPLRGELE